MAIEKITMPQLGESVTEGTISRWLVSVGDHVNKYDPLVEIISDKVTAEVPSSFTGVVKEIVADTDQTLLVNEVICSIETDSATEKKPEETIVEENKPEEKEMVKKEMPPERTKKMRYSPAVLKLSQEHGIDLNLVSGTGLDGRITRKDVLKIIEQGEISTINIDTEPTTSTESISRPMPAFSAEIQIEATKGDIEIPVNGVRKAIAEQMVKSKYEIPHAYMMVEVDATNLVQYRDGIKNEFKKKEGFNLTYFAFFVKAVAQALKEYPGINAMWAGDKIIHKKDINLNIAVATDHELFTPVIRNADEKSIKGIAREISEYGVKVRTGKLQVEDLKGGTFTVNNTGTIGSVQSMGIINQPQAAILQVESIIKRPVVINNMIAIRDMVNLCLSLDHRVLDGYICGLFMRRVKEILENTS
ncbi:MAG: dihydrolipoamide acetyltransferase family protein, partial [Bacillus sp. (in: firmicutes)]